MTDLPWHATHDADGRYRDPVERANQWLVLTKGAQTPTTQLMSDLAALCEALAYQAAANRQRNPSSKISYACTFEEIVSAGMPREVAEAMENARNPDGSPRFPAKEKEG